MLLENELGSLEAWLEVSDAVRPGVVAIAGRWWRHPTETAAVGNLLVPASWSPGGQPAYNDCFVTVSAVVEAPPA